MGMVAALPADQRIAPLDQATGLRAGMPAPEADKAIDAFLDKLYGGTRMGDRTFRLSLIDKSTADLTATGDTFVALAAALEPLNQANRDGTKERTGLKGILEKQTGQGDFNAPQKQIDAIAAFENGKPTPFADAALHDVPVNFLSTVDTTGGNSGSPTLNARGELVGLLFDGTYESVSSDYLFDEVKTRSIHVDSRYMLWNMAEVDGATNLLKEMGITPGKRITTTAAAPAVAPVSGY
jgi:hypothetical protein